MMKKYILIAAMLDRQLEEAMFIQTLLNERGINNKLVDLSIHPEHTFDCADFSYEDIASFHHDGFDIINNAPRHEAIKMMADAFTDFILVHYDISAIIGLGDSDGIALITPAMQSLPIGMPKMILSSMAIDNISHYVGNSDLTIIHMINLVGVNLLSQRILRNAVDQISGAVLFSDRLVKKTNKKSIGLTIFGSTTPCIKNISQLLSSSFDCQVFHATGKGGLMMENFVNKQEMKGMIDITLTEINDYLFGGVLGCTHERLNVLKQSNIPAILSCGAIDMINFGALDTVPLLYQDRRYYQYNNQVTLIRSSAEENYQLGIWIGNKLNQSIGEVVFIIPEKGFSLLDIAGGPFYDPLADQAFIDGLESTVQQTDKRKIIKYPYHINDMEFSQFVTNTFTKLLNTQIM